ncbi:uncharacterized protein LOC130736577 [Lotus japonicus]|uniref:uncharacterized protein LOC130736577 n=1 Tax=Lotus japonicus TaxID=34305 RepID=UPI00258FBC87|nr:uncharacterized protein LOC130736577 [Lotus japonicus]
MGLKSGSSQPSPMTKKAPGKMKTRYPARKTYMSKVQNKEPANVPLCEDVTDEEEINAEDSPLKSPPNVVPDVETSVSQEIYDQENSGNVSTTLEDSGKATKPDVSVSSSSKDADPKNGNSEDINSAKPTQAPAHVQDISNDVSDDVPLVKSIPDSVAARMKRKRKVSTPEVTPTPPKRSKSSLVTYKSKQASVKDKGKQKAVKSPTLGRSVIEFADEEVSMDDVAKELTADYVKKWPNKKLLSTGNLSVKYAIFNRNGAVNWETIRVSTARMLKVDALLLKLQEEERQGGEQRAAATAADDESSEEEEGSEESAEENAEESREEEGSEDYCYCEDYVCFSSVSFGLFNLKTSSRQLLGKMNFTSADLLAVFEKKKNVSFPPRVNLKGDKTPSPSNLEGEDQKRAPQSLGKEVSQPSFKKKLDSVAASSSGGEDVSVTASTSSEPGGPPKTTLVPSSGIQGELANRAPPGINSTTT